ncbi:MAG: branched-chain amino acid transport system ATP-binding protein [Haloarculaceae archaeon]|jgi:branched-chain amino acid transport system ATP-binding protein
MSLLELQDVVKEFGGLTAVDEVDLKVESGETYAIIGPNGAGKTTTINCVSGLLEPTSGTIIFDGDEITGAAPHETVQRGISKSFQTASIFPTMSVEENVLVAALGAEHGSFSFNFLTRRQSYDEIYETAEEMLRAVDLWEDRNIEAQSLPYGDKRRLEIAIALASAPELLFMDEPTAGMSPEETDATVDLIEELQEDLGLTIVLVEHDMEVIFRVADKIAVLNRGRIIADGTPDQVKGDPEVQEAYLGGVEI